MLRTPTEIAQHLQVPLATVYYWVHRKEIPFIKVGRHLRFEIEKVNKFFSDKTLLSQRSCLNSTLNINNQPLVSSLKTNESGQVDLQRKEN